MNESSIGRWLVAKKAAESLDSMTRGKYPAPYMALDSVVYSLGASSIDDALDYEAKLFGQLAIAPESKALMAVYYLMESAKKIPKALKPKSPLPEVRKIGIIGAGVMGAQIAAIAANKGFLVFVRDINDKAVEAGLRHIRDIFDQSVAKKRMTPDERSWKLSKIQASTSLDGFQDCDVVIEAAVEKLALKQRILQEVEKLLPPNAIFATNTSSLSVTALAKSSSKPGQVCGMHFFNPVQKMPLVEVIRGAQTFDYCLAVVYKLSLMLGKTPCVCADGPGFVVNRILGIYMNEAGLLAMEGNPISVIDQALLDFGMPMGPFRLMDEVGLDVAAHVGPILEQGLGSRFKQNPKFAKILIEDPKRVGRKSGVGFYIYEPGKTNPKKLNEQVLSEVSKLRGHKTSLSSAKTIVDRCILVALQEACYILSDKICDSPAVLDLAMIFGTGFAPFRGGLLNYADQIGIETVVSLLKQLANECGERFDPCPMLTKMASESTLFFPGRPHGMTAIKHLPRSKYQSKL